MKMYDLNGVLLWSVGGTALPDGDTTNVGVLLGAPSGVRFSQDESYVVVAEAYSHRVTKWNATTGAYIGTVGSGFINDVDVTECWTGAGVGTIVSDLGNNRVVLVSETGAITATAANYPRIVSVALVPGVGMIVLGQTGGVVTLLSSVAIATHPVSATVAAPATASFSVTLTGNSATTGLTYVWTKSGVVVGTNSASYSYTTTAADSGFVFQVVVTVTNAMGSAVSRTAYLSVQVWWPTAGVLGEVADQALASGHACAVRSHVPLRVWWQCEAGKYSSGGAGCLTCPPYTTAASPGALACLPTCPVVSQLSLA
jgi:hypothetical protein